MITKRRTLLIGVAAGAAATFVAIATAGHAAEEPTVIELTQVPCQFLESENGFDHGFTTARKEDCEAINSQSGEERLSSAQVLNLTPGNYVFRVTNQNVPYPLGFWIREHNYDWRNPLHKVTKTSVSGGGMATGVTLDYEVELEAGHEYVYSCPLNPTPDYRIVVN